MDVTDHFAGERNSCKELMLEYCSTNSMVADCFTNALPPGKLSLFCAGWYCARVGTAFLSPTTLLAVIP